MVIHSFINDSMELKFLSMWAVYLTKALILFDEDINFVLRWHLILSYESSLVYEGTERKGKT